MSDVANNCLCCDDEIAPEDRNFRACVCQVQNGMAVCVWCWNRMRELAPPRNVCPLCRDPYGDEPYQYSAVDMTANSSKKEKKKEKKGKDEKIAESRLNGTNAGQGSGIDRRHLHNYRVIQRNLVYVIGLPSSSGSEESLRRTEYFGQYGNIAKIVIHKNQNSAHSNSVSAYITFSYKEDAKAAIQAIEGFTLEGHHLRASFGTTKYCNNFIRGNNCANPDCVYLHELGDDEDRFTKEEIQAGQSKITHNPGKGQTLVTGSGGPSGTGKRPGTEKLILPQPTFIQDKSKAGASKSSVVATGAKVASWATGGASGTVTASGKNSSKGGEKEKSGKAEAKVEPKGAGTKAAKDKPGDAAVPDEGPTLKTERLSKEEIRKLKDIELQGKRRAAIEKREAVQRSANREKEPASRVKSVTQGEADPKFSRNSKAGETSATVEQKTMKNSSALSGSTDSRTIDNALDGFDLKGPTYNVKVEPSFNGIGRCAVFPVPRSSLSISSWANVLNLASADLSSLGSNPFTGTRVSVAELLDLTLPPVDAVTLSPWPKPMSHYGTALGGNDVHGQSAAAGGNVSNMVANRKPAASGDAGSSGLNSLSTLKSILPNANVRLL